MQQKLLIKSKTRPESPFQMWLLASQGLKPQSLDLELLSNHYILYGCQHNAAFDQYLDLDNLTWSDKDYIKHNLPRLHHLI